MSTERKTQACPCCGTNVPAEDLRPDTGGCAGCSPNAADFEAEAERERVLTMDSDQWTPHWYGPERDL